MASKPIERDAMYELELSNDAIEYLAANTDKNYTAMMDILIVSAIRLAIAQHDDITPNGLKDVADCVAVCTEQAAHEWAMRSFDHTKATVQ